MSLISKSLQNLSSCYLFRLQVHTHQRHGISTASHPLLFKFTPKLDAEPIKKKKKTDASLTLEREKKKRKRLEKQIEKTLAAGRKLKPVSEIAGYNYIRKSLNQRRRHSNEPQPTREEQFAKECEHRDFVHAWSDYHFNLQAKEDVAISKAFASQKKALAALREESERLYQLAIRVDRKLIPWDGKGPLYTPSNKNYSPPVGEINDCTDKFDRTYIADDLILAPKRSK